MYLIFQPNRVERGRIEAEQYFTMVCQEIGETAKDLAVILGGNKTVPLKTGRINNDSIVGACWEIGSISGMMSMCQFYATQGFAEDGLTTIQSNCKQSTYPISVVFPKS